MCFFHLKFLNVWGILAQKIYDVHAIFRQFSYIKKGDNRNNQVLSVHWLPVNANALELAVLRKVNLIF